MDTEEGVEVVWNEVRFSERKYFKAKEEIISDVFDRLIQLEHPNIVKLHKYWIHKDADMPRVIFITEYMSSGSLKQFLRKTKRHDIKMGLQVHSYLSGMNNCFYPFFVAQIGLETLVHANAIRIVLFTFISASNYSRKH